MHSICQGYQRLVAGVDHADPIGMPINSRVRLAMLALLFAPFRGQVSLDAVPLASQGNHLPVQYVFDGDTISVGPRVPVRLLGIDTPEFGAGFDTPAPFALEARTHLRSLVANRHVRLETDREETVRYGRRLAYVFRDDGLFVNEEMLRAGFARVSARGAGCGEASRPSRLVEQRPEVQGPIGTESDGTPCTPRFGLTDTGHSATLPVAPP
jgi:endonuclease YncB( thermonuclease family)